MKRLAAGLLGLSMAATACGRAGAPSASEGPLVPRVGSSAVEETAAIYATVIRRLVAKDASADGALALKAVYVINGPVPHAENPVRPLSEQVPPSPFGTAVKDALRRELGDLPPLTFIKVRSSVIEGSPPGQAINDGVIITLGPIHGDSAAVRVGNSYWRSGDDGQWLTYVIAETATGWAITGTDGPVAIS